MNETTARQSGPDSRQPGTLRAIGVLALPAILLTIIIVTWVGAGGGDAAESGIETALPYLIAVNHAVVFAVLLWLLRREGRSLADIGWRAVPEGSRPSRTVRGELAWGVALGLSLYLAKELGFDSIRALVEGSRPTFTTLFNLRWNPSELPLLVVATTFIAVEESVYRGYGLRPLVDRFGAPGGLAVMGLLFGLLHWGNGGLAIVFTGLIGVAFGVVFLWRRTLAAVLVAHALYNAMVILT